jgi:hypothetical protein
MFTIVLAATNSLAGELKVVALQRLEDAVTLKTPVGSLPFPARRLILQGHQSDGRGAECNLLLLFDPRSGGFFWWCPLTSPSESPKLGNFAAVQLGMISAYVAPDRIVGVLAYGGPPDIYIKEFTTKAHSMDDAEAKAIRELSEQMDVIRSNPWSGWTKTPLIDELGGPIKARDFLAPKFSAEWGRIKIIDISHVEGSWQITLEGQWIEKLYLNEKFEFIKLERPE